MERDDVADVLDELLQVLAAGRRGGERRVPTSERTTDWVTRWRLLESEARMVMKVEDTNNKRNAARRKQMARSRRMNPKMG